MFEFTIVAFVALGLTIILAYAASKPSLKEIEEASKQDASHTSDLPFNEDFPVVTEEVKPKMSKPKKAKAKTTKTK